MNDQTVYSSRKHLRCYYLQLHNYIKDAFVLFENFA